MWLLFPALWNDAENVYIYTFAASFHHAGNSNHTRNICFWCDIIFWMKITQGNSISIQSVKKLFNLNKKQLLIVIQNINIYVNIRIDLFQLCNHFTVTNLIVLNWQVFKNNQYIWMKKILRYCLVFVYFEYLPTTVLISILQKVGRYLKK